MFKFWSYLIKKTLTKVNSIDKIISELGSKPLNTNETVNKAERQNSDCDENASLLPQNNLSCDTNNSDLSLDVLAKSAEVRTSVSMAIDLENCSNKFVWHFLLLTAILMEIYPFTLLSNF